MTSLAAPAPSATRSLFGAPLNELDLVYLDGRRWRVERAFSYRSSLLGRFIEVPIGFVTDFASIPQVFWNLFPPTGGYGKAALIHDFLYQHGARQHRDQADRVFLEAMTQLGVNWWTRRILYAGVRLGGSSSYHRDTP